MGAKIIQGINDLETKRPDLVKEWHSVLNGDVLPSQVGFSSNKKRWWKCKLGHEWQASPNSRIMHAGLCPYCNGKRVWPGFNDLSSQHPAIAAMWHPTLNGNLQPNDVTYGSGKKVWWICSNGHEHQATVNSKLKQKVKCPYCANQAIASGFNDLATRNPELASEWHPTRNIGLFDGNGKDISTPNKISNCSSQKFWWLGTCGHEWETSIHSRTRGGAGCPICNESHGEKEVRKTLESLHINFKEQFVFADRKYSQKGALKDDFAIIQNNSVIGTIEYNGEHHYKVVDFSGHNPKKAQEQFNKVQQRDKVKSDYLKAHGIPQLIIPYWQFNETEQLVIEFLKELRLVDN